MDYFEYNAQRAARPAPQPRRGLLDRARAAYAAAMDEFADHAHDALAERIAGRAIGAAVVLVLVSLLLAVSGCSVLPAEPVGNWQTRQTIDDACETYTERHGGPCGLPASR